MAAGIIDADLDNIDEPKLLFLIQQILECLQDEAGHGPKITPIRENVMLFELDEYKFSLTIQNLNVLQ